MDKYINNKTIHPPPQKKKKKKKKNSAEINQGKMGM